MPIKGDIVICSESEYACRGNKPDHRAAWALKLFEKQIGKLPYDADEVNDILWRSDMKNAGGSRFSCGTDWLIAGPKTEGKVERSQNMTTKEDILAYINYKKEQMGDKPECQPIFALFLFEKPNEEKIYDVNGVKKPSGFPDTGAAYEPGFYHVLDWAIEAMNNNVCDIHETCYDAGFILCRFPGMYDCVGKEARMYFLWDAERQGFFQQEEPEIFRHIAY